MKGKFLFAAMLFCYVSNAQQLTVEKIMQDPKWIGTQPSNISWGLDSKQVFFSWNPDKNISDSVYTFSLGSKDPVKASYKQSLMLNAMNNGTYNKNNSRLVFTYNGDVYVHNVSANNSLRITQTEEIESNPKFVANDEWISYTKNQNLYIWNFKTGITKQLSNFSRAPETIVRSASSDTSKEKTVPVATLQPQWLQQNQLETSSILKERKQKKDARDAYIKKNKETDTLRAINIGEKAVQNIQVSPDTRFITYRLFTAPTPASKNTMVPDYVTESGFTTDIPGRTKVGNIFGSTAFYVNDREKDTVMMIKTDDLPGILDEPDYVKDYPKKFSKKRTTPRPVTINGPYWNEAGSAAFIDVRSQDNKDRWLMKLNAATGKLSLIDRQRDDAWIAGPGISGGGRQGWVNNEIVYFQSEANGYSQLYAYNITTSAKKAITQGAYEVQDVTLSKDKKYFYLLTNEEHPGKQNYYRINVDGSGKQKITSLTGGYEVALSPDEKYIAYRYSYSNKPWELFVQENTDGKKPMQVTAKSMSDDFKTYNWREPKMVEIPARDGGNIYARMYEPEVGKKNGAAVVFVHGAGYLQNVHYWWSSYFREYMFNNLLVDKGYTVIDVDYRASSGYGRNWRTGIYRFMGGKDLDDHEDAINYLVKNSGIDAKRIGMYGGSYGGFITLMAMFTKPDLIKAGAALRPVTDWGHYNHGYTANILNEPFNDSISYAKSSPINFASGLKNNLLICHGMVDVNVNFQDAVRLSQRLIELGKDDWELAPYPVEDHGFVEPSSWTDEYKRILKLFEANLLK